MMDKQAFMQLVDKIVDGSATAQEVSLYNNYINHFVGDHHWEEETMGEEEATKAELFNMINISAKAKVIPFYQRKTFSYLVAACLVLIVAAVGTVFYHQRAPNLKESKITVLQNDVAPGGNNAVLTLANGAQVVLNSVNNGKIADESGITITKTKDGQLIYQMKEQSLTTAKEAELVVTYNTISTPRGGQYQISLPDGTQVWLNASSSLKFPTSFVGNQRNVQLTGEAYFEVAKNKQKPFVVQVDDMKVEVLGTHFDVMAYPEEKTINTTLIEGVVSVVKNKESQILAPGQQAMVDEGIRVVEASADAVAWKNGLTSFENADIKTIMRQVARWYDVEVNYEGEIPKRLFTGQISRKANLSELIKVIEWSDIHLSLKGNVITVRP